ncbi:cysteine--tRNA ligase [SAR202 cluster bacterium AD-802-E10_MRT_200m]|nr:cysteine--tRNA ligase [SAR202 cluster bacterium AD-802-E10_MRT_200m]
MRLFDTLSNEKVDFEPLGNEVKLYVCGVTPYSPSHVGHAMSYIYFDVLRRYLEFRGYKVRHIQNFTDIDDKIIGAALGSGLQPDEMAEGFIQEYLADMDDLNIKRADGYPRATQEIEYIIKMLQQLIDTGYAYSASGDVYFRVNSFRGYGKLGHRTLEGMMAGARVEVDESKEHPMDFALWKSAKPNEPFWESPWGPGRPGWHIECSAMSLRYLGENLDIHGGGQDLVFPHHENEIAQSEAYTGSSPFVRHWMHNGLLQLDDTKMSKSLGNLVTVRDALSRHEPDTLRLFFLSSHYHNPLTYSDENVLKQSRALQRLRSTFDATGDDNVSKIETIDIDEFQNRFIESMDDDLNTPRALAVIFDLAREINRSRREGRKAGNAQRLLSELTGVLGLSLESRLANPLEIDPFVELLLDVRDKLRQAKEFGLADTIRERLDSLGVSVEDSSQDTRWKYRAP